MPPGAIGEGLRVNQGVIIERIGRTKAGQKHTEEELIMMHLQGGHKAARLTMGPGSVEVLSFGTVERAAQVTNNTRAAITVAFCKLCGSVEVI